MMAKRTKSMAKKNMDTFFLRCSVDAALVPSQGVLVSNYVYGYFPLVAANPTSVWNNADFLFYNSIYDKVRVNSITVKMIPKANVFDQANANNDTNLNLTGNGLVHTVVDRNGTGPSNVGALTRYPSYRKHSVMKPITRTYKVSYPKGMWLQTGSSPTGPAGNISLIAQLGLNGGVTVYGEDLLEDKLEVFNEPWASATLTYDCVFQGKTGAAIKVNNDGTFTFTPNSIIPNAALSPILGLGGTIADTYVTEDLSGQLINNPRQPDDFIP